MSCFLHKERREVPLEEAFPFLSEKKHVVSLVGAGGKTTVMYALAECVCKLGHRTLVTTSTHIRKPGSGIPGKWIQNETEMEQIWQQGGIAIAGKEEGEKFAMPDTEQLFQYFRRADTVLIEADGAKEKPCKVPAGHEPVLLPESDIVIAVMGLDALGRKIKDVCFRVEEVCALLQKTPEERLTESDMVKILTSEAGARKNVGNRTYYAVLNKYDLLRTQESAEKLLKLLREQEISNIVFTSFLPEKTAVR